MTGALSQAIFSDCAATSLAFSIHFSEARRASEKRKNQVGSTVIYGP